jgi:hypothetical protein
MPQSRTMSARMRLRSALTLIVPKTSIAKRLSEEECWPIRPVSPSIRYAKASSLVLLEEPMLDGFLSDSIRHVSLCLAIVGLLLT